MRILFVNPYYKPYLGGIERAIERLGVQFLKDEQVEAVGVLTTHWAFPRRRLHGLPAQEIVDGLRIYRIPSWPDRAPPFFQVPLVWFSPFEFKAAIRDFRPDIIQLMTDKWFWGNFWALYWGRRLKAKIGYSLSYHPSGGRQSRLLARLAKQFFLRPINDYLANRADFIHAITQHEKQLIAHAYGTHQDKIRVIPWGVSMPSRVAGFKKLPAAGGIRILAVGRLSEHKGQGWLVEIFAQLIKIVHPSVRLVLVGAEEKNEAVELRELIIRLGVGERVEITGPVDDNQLKCLYEMADIFALFPEYEAFGLAFLEAMAQGLPVVTHQVGALSEVLKKGALLISPYNQAQAQVALTKLIEDDEYRRALGQEAREFVAQHFSWSQTAASFLNIYQKR